MITSSLILFAAAAVLPATTGSAGCGAATARNDAGFVRDFYAAYTSKDAARLAGFYASDAVFEDPSFNLNLRGAVEIQALLAKALAKYESLNFEIARTVSAPDALVVEGTMTGRIRGQAVRVRFISVFNFTGGRISVQHDLFDVHHLLAQLQLPPARAQH